MTTSATRIDFSIPAMREWRKIPEGVLAEVIFGKLYVSPSPNTYHSLISARIRFKLWKHISENGLGELYDPPVDIFLEVGTNVVIPDIIFIQHGSTRAVVDKRGIHGPPDLCIEILSPKTKKRDLTIKRSLYEQSGVKEYWTVDPVTREACGYLLVNNHYNEPLLMHSKLHIRILDKTISF